ncbi:MAG: hypothetical protein J1E06_06285 [Acutalibacter sp.]|nr:hypothetical protein [Acutalibacter sp.]
MFAKKHSRSRTPDVLPEKSPSFRKRKKGGRLFLKKPAVPMNIFLVFTVHCKKSKPIERQELYLKAQLRTVSDETASRFAALHSLPAFSSAERISRVPLGW